MGNKQHIGVRRWRGGKKETGAISLKNSTDKAKCSGERSIINQMSFYIIADAHFFTIALNGEDAPAQGQRGAFICCPCHWVYI